MLEQQKSVAVLLGVAVLGCAGTAACTGPTPGGHIVVPLTSMVGPARESIVHRLLAVADFDGPDFNGDIETFPLKGNGDLFPTAILSGSNTGIANPGSVAIDPTGRIYSLTTDSHTISVFAPGASGNVAPERTIVDAEASHYLGYLGADAAGNAYALFYNDKGVPLGIDVFPPNASGPTEPVRTISDSKTLLGTSIVDQFLVDPHGGTWWYSDGEVGTNQIVGYAPGANGNVKPARQIGGSRAFPTFVGSFAVAPDGGVFADGELVYVFGPRQNGNVRAHRTLQHDVCDCFLRLFDRGLIYYAAVSYKGQAGVIAFDASASGNVAPSLVMTGANTGLTQPDALAGQ